MSDRRWLLAALALALAWGVGPALPALLRGELLGHPHTDLYPSVWGLWAFAQAQPALPDHTALLGFPDGMGFYYSSPIKGWLATPLLPLLGLPATFDLLVVASRVATVLVAFLAGRAWGLGGAGALAAAAVYGCAPFFHGYAVEGIVEGTDGWTLALWAWAAGRGRHGLAAVALALTVLSSWYLGMAGCLLAVLATLRDRKAPLALLGLLLAAPALLRFAGAFPEAAPLDDAVRRMMGAHPGVPTPGLTEGLQPFAINTYVGWLVAGLAVWSRHPAALLAAIPAVLSLGAGPWYELPVLELVRFPYRWHAATLALLALAVGHGVERPPRLGGLAGPLIALEGLLLSPVEPIIPGADAAVPPLVAAIDRPVLDVPGPVAMPPGQPNPSRRRARYVLYWQHAHGQPSPWVPDFNSVGVEVPADRVTAPLEAWDRIVSKAAPAALAPGAVAALADAGIGAVVLHRAELGDARLAALRDQLVAQGATLITDDGDRWLLHLPPR